MRSRLGQDMAGARSSLTSMFDSLGIMLQASLTARIVNAIAAAPYQIAESVYEAGKAATFARTTFEAMSGSAEGAANMFDELQGLARGMALPTTQVLHFGQEMMAVGFEADQIVPVLYRLAEAAAAGPLGLQVGVDRMVRVMGMIREFGTLEQRHARNLISAGVDVYGMLAAKLGITTAEVQKLIHKRGIDSATAIGAIMEGIDKRFGGAIEKRIGTFYGAMEALHAFLMDLFMDVGLKIGDTLTPMFSGLQSFLLSPAAQQWAADIVSGAGEVVRMLIGIYEAGKRILGVFGDEFMGMIGGFFQWNITLHDVVEWVINAAAAVAQFVDEHRDMVRAVIVGVGGLIGLSVALGVLGEAAAIVLNPILLLIAGVIGLAYVAEKLGVEWVVVFATIAAALTNLQLAFDIAVQALAVGLSGAGDAFNDLWKFLKTTAQATFETIVAGLKALVEEFIDASRVMQQTMAGTVGIMPKLAKAAFDEAMSAGASKHVEVVLAEEMTKIMARALADASKVGGKVAPAVAKAWSDAVAKAGGFTGGPSDRTLTLMEDLDAMTRVFRVKVNEMLAMLSIPGLPGLPNVGGFKPPPLPNLGPGKETPIKIGHAGLEDFAKKLQESITGTGQQDLQKAAVNQLKDIKVAVNKVDANGVDANKALKEMLGKMGFGQ